MNPFDCMAQLKSLVKRPLKVSLCNPCNCDMQLQPWRIKSQRIYIFPKHTGHKKTVNSVLRSFLCMIELNHGYIRCEYINAESIVKKQWFYGISYEEMADDINKTWDEFCNRVVNYEPVLFMAAMLDDIPNIKYKWDLKSSNIRTLSVEILPKAVPNKPYGPYSKYLALKEGYLETGYTMPDFFCTSSRDYKKHQVAIGNPDCFKMVKSYLMSPYKCGTGWKYHTKYYF